MNILGLDIGSSRVKICLKKGSELYFFTLDTYSFYKDFFQEKKLYLEKLTSYFGLPLGEDKIKIGVTGYGRNRLDFIKDSYNEMKMHFLGAKYQTGEENFILLDIGGQDTKVIKVVEGRMVDFSTNDRCAAGTGKFLENSCRVMGMEIEKFASFYKNPVEITSKCSVFAETEIIELIASGHTPSEIAAGLNKSLIKKILPLLEPFFYNEDKLVFVGGMALWPGVIYFLKEELSKENIEVIVPPRPLHNGALGVVLALEEKRGG